MRPTMRRNALLRGLMLTLGALVFVGQAQAQTATWPSKPIRLIVAFPPGGLADVLARKLAGPLGEALGQTVVIDNRGGAGGNVAASEMVRGGADGHTFMVNVTTLESVNPLMFNPMPLDVTKDIQPVALLANTQLFLVTRNDLPVSNTKEFAAYAKANPGKLSYGSAGNGTTIHIAGELFKQLNGIHAVHIPYRGAAPVIQDLLAGQIDFSFLPGTVLSFVKAGKLKLFAVSSRQRTQNYPSAPTVEESGNGKVYVETSFAVYAPTSMPAANVQRMNQEINRWLALPATKAFYTDFAADPVPLSPAELKTVVQAEGALFGAVVKTANIKAE